MDLLNKKAVVLGIGSSGQSAARLLLKQGAKVMVRDTGKPEALQDKAVELRDWATSRGLNENLQIELGDMVKSTADFDLAILSPGIDPTKPFVKPLFDHKVPVWSELELGYRFCACPIVAITGTNGKTTTTELVHDVLAAGGKRTAMAGNIGTPLCDLAESSHALDVLVVEVSSFQLEQIELFRPKVSIHLNLTPDHLDRYPNMEAYRNAKWQIFRNQDETDLAIVNKSVALPVNPPVRAQTIVFSVNDPISSAPYQAHDGCLFVHQEAIFDQSTTHLIGPHNSENLLAALIVADYFNLPRPSSIKALQAYHPQPHRCEVVARRNGIVYINDSKATNIDALEKALLAVPAPIILLAGGKDKGLEFAHLRPILQEKVTCAVLIGQMQKKLTETWQGAVTCRPAGSLAEAVQICHSLAEPGHTVLFSPGCSSFDMFKNYEDRGDQFRKLVQDLIPLTPTANNPN